MEDNTKIVFISDFAGFSNDIYQEGFKKGQFNGILMTVMWFAAMKFAKTIYKGFTTRKDETNAVS